MEAFVYCWTDFGTNKLYVGVHKGTQDDGYICSSGPMKEEYSKRPGDFTRQIVAQGLFLDMYALETALLVASKADKDPGFYNMHLNNGKFTNEGITHSAKTRNRISKSRQGQEPWNKGKLGVQVPWNKGKKTQTPWLFGVARVASTKLKISRKLKGRAPWNKGRTNETA